MVLYFVTRAVAIDAVAARTVVKVAVVATLIVVGVS